MEVTQFRKTWSSIPPSIAFLPRFYCVSLLILYIVVYIRIVTLIIPACWVEILEKKSDTKHTKDGLKFEVALIKHYCITYLKRLILLAREFTNPVSKQRCNNVVDVQKTLYQRCINAFWETFQKSKRFCLEYLLKKSTSISFWSAF